MNNVPFAFGLDDLITWAVILLFFIVPAIGQLLAKVKQAPPPAGGGRPQRPAPHDVEDEIEVFMRRALGQRAEKEPPVRARPAPVAQPVEAEVVAAAPVGGQVASEVRRHLDSGEFVQRTGRLGKEVVQTDKQLEQHLHQAFDHKLGQLESAEAKTSPPRASDVPPDLSGPTAVEVPPTVAAGLAAMLGNAESLSQAIVLSEIIHRPEERWA